MSKRSFGSYIAELAIVIIGVTVAFWISTMAEREKDTEIKINYFAELVEDIDSDIKDLEYALKLNRQKQNKLGSAVSFYEDPIKFKDSIIQSAFLVGNYYFFEPDDITYQSIIASGDLKLIHDKEVKKGLVRLYGTYHSIEKMQEKFLEALDQNYFPLLVKNIDYSNGSLKNINFVKDLQVKNYILYSVNELEVHIKWYELAIKRGNSLKELLQNEIAENKGGQ